MRSLFTLLFLCIFSWNAHAWDGELYALGGVGKSIQNERWGFSGNFGMGTVTKGELGYFNAGVNLYYLSGTYQSNYGGVYYGSKSVSENYLFDFALGGGVCLQSGITTFRIGPDVAMNFSLNNGNMHVSITPKAVLTFDAGGSEIGIMVKRNLPVLNFSRDTYSGRGYAPGFFGGGVVLNF